MRFYAFFLLLCIFLKLSLRRRNLVERGDSINFHNAQIFVTN